MALPPPSELRRGRETKGAVGNKGHALISTTAASNTSNREWAQAVKGGGGEGSSTKLNAFTLCPHRLSVRHRCQVQKTRTSNDTKETPKETKETPPPPPPPPSHIY